LKRAGWVARSHRRVGVGPGRGCPPPHTTHFYSNIQKKISLVGGGVGRWTTPPTRDNFLNFPVKIACIFIAEKLLVARNRNWGLNQPPGGAEDEKRTRGLKI